MFNAGSMESRPQQAVPVEGEFVDKEPSTYQKGKRGERVAIEYLEKIGYRIIATNYRTSGAEIDIVALSKNEVVVLEVKSGRHIHDFLEEKITGSKKRKVERIAREFLYRRHMSHLPVRFEVIAVAFPENEVHHFPEQFFDG